MSDEESTALLFLRIGWMHGYQGLSEGDAIVGGGGFVRERGYGHEIYNFLPWQDRVYGYVQPIRAGYNDELGTGIRIERLGASRQESSMAGITAVWVATSPTGGQFIVGWYRNATVHRRWQKPPAGSLRRYRDEEFGYYVTAASADAVLLRPDERVFSVPHGAGGMGQSNVWYADGSDDETREFRDRVVHYLATRIATRTKAITGGARQPDPLRRSQVERAAIEKTIAYYTSLGYSVDSVEADNMGWDLDATHDVRRTMLRLEVKGLSGCDTVIELTPNEYAKMQSHRDSYRICVVTNALADPILDIFAYSADSGRWEDPRGRGLDMTEIISARCAAPSR